LGDPYVDVGKGVHGGVAFQNPKYTLDCVGGSKAGAGGERVTNPPAQKNIK